MIELCIAYFLCGFVYLFLEILYLKKKKRLELISLFRMMYAIIYGFFPGIFLIRMVYGVSSINIFFEEKDYLVYGSISLIFSVVMYIVLSLTYNITARAKAFYSKSKHFYSISTIKVSIVILLLIGIVSLFLWTRAFGSLWNFIVSANGIRSRTSTVNNPLAFLEHFTKVFQICCVLSFAVFICEKRCHKKSLFSFCLFLVSLFFSLIVMLCTDSRGVIGMVMMTLIIYYFNEKIINKNYSVKKTVFFLVSLSAFALILIVASENVMNFIRFGSVSTGENMDFFTMLEQEFGYTFNSQILAVKTISNNPFNFKFFNDIINSIFSYVPSRFIPFELPTDLWDYNTERLCSLAQFYGQAPTDFLTAGLYSFGLLGVILYPLLFGFVLKKIETVLNRKSYSLYYMAYHCRFMYYSLWWVSHMSISYSILHMFGMIFTHIVVRFTLLFTRRENYYAKKSFEKIYE